MWGSANREWSVCGDSRMFRCQQQAAGQVAAAGMQPSVLQSAYKPQHQLEVNENTNKRRVFVFYVCVL